MLRDITFGKYYNTKSLIHDTDGRINFLRFIVYMISVIIIKNPQCFLFAVLFLVITVLLSKIPFSYVLKGVWGAKFYIVLCVVLRLVSDRSLQGLTSSVFLLVRLVLLVISASIFTLTTTVGHISDTFEWYLSPLKYLGVPVRDIALMLSIALRFIPVLANEAEHIIQAQKARGAKLTNGSLIKRAKAFIPLIIPIFESAVRRASELADALKARAYGTYENRTRLNPLKFKKNDLYTFFCLVAYLILIIAVNNYGY